MDMGVLRYKGVAIAMTYGSFVESTIAFAEEEGSNQALLWFDRA